MTLPANENTLSAGALLAGIERNFNATFDRRG